MGRHSRPSKTKTILKRTGVTAAMATATVGGIGLVGGGTADAFPGQNGLVQCESGGNPAAVNNTAAGQQAGRPAGLFQIVTGTWLANGGGQFAPTADRATPAQQQIVADRIYASQGASPWECKPGNGPALFGSFGQSGAAAPAKPQANAPAKPQATPQAKSQAKPQASAPARSATPAPAPAGEPTSNPKGDYTVVAGDTLSGIAQKFDVPGGWSRLATLNSQYIPNPNLILVGEKIATR